MGTKCFRQLYSGRVESAAAIEPKIKTICLERSQIRLAPLDLESLIDAHHPARTIWEVSGKFDLKRFEEGMKTREGEAGRPCWPSRGLSWLSTKAEMLRGRWWAERNRAGGGK